ncbi:ComEA family DNA-binding protein [Psychromonas antarctica]|uniref:ComEA family DNA-binding protein n=1 Tax=Psychromonas antarctica TaxID=67573 RepID=UPI001EE953D5|nr:helix-hairpin-helix domain-containing protein [Psychromonas antarctica]MCG6202121.1 helix-hairpin-helix domain-containing protein [Psychromonas antarctica]
MFNKFIHSLFVVLSLLLLSSSLHVFAADKTVQPMTTSVEMTEKINLNQATSEQLATIKGLGQKKAQAIVDYRQENGAFISFEQLVDVKGIGPGTLKKIQPWLTL